jgi:glyoxylase-like metal-dependent hydrolase (beta-lactamase superfamily II)/rhodanese-related sulfurtransferase
VVEVVVVPTESLGDRSYVVHDGGVALVVDPQRDVDRIEKVLADLHLTCTHVVETHIHNDYVSGGLVLARNTGAAYVVAGLEEVAFDRQPVDDGDQFVTGSMTVTAVATPGHTDGHLAYIVEDRSEEAGPPAVFTGGSLLYGSVGRTDLVDPGRTEELTRRQYRSARKLASMLGDDAQVYPTHGFGSFCSSGSATGGDTSTIGTERSRNDALTTDDEERFVARLVAGLTAYPAYYVHMGPRNRQGAGPIDLSLPELADAEELERRILAGEWVVDLRSQTAFAAEHLAGTVSVALGTSFATYLGWVLPWGTPLTLLGEDADQVVAAQRQLVRIGIDRPDAAAIGSPSELARGSELASFLVTDFEGLAAAQDPVVLDVRRHDEHEAGHIPGSIHIPLHDLIERLDELPGDQLWVHCASGFRASIAASLLDRAGRDVVLVHDNFASAGALLGRGGREATVAT